MKDTFTIQEAAKVLGISDQAVHKRISSGALKAVKVNKRWLIDAASLEASRKDPPKRGRPYKSDRYVLMNGAYVVMEFAYRPESQDFIPGEVADALRAPIGTVGRNGQALSTGLKAWWQHRSIPESRAGMDARLQDLGIAEPAQIPFRNLGFSLSDQYWICPAGETLKWEDLNYFQNDFGAPIGEWDEWMSQVGLSSPDNTSEGALSKRWLCEGKKRYLLKGHTPWTDQQVYNEAVATQLHSRLLNESEFISYDVASVESLGVVSRCECFIKPNEEYVPMSLLLDSEGQRRGEPVYGAIVRICRNLQIPDAKAKSFLAKMIVTDSIMANTDRHLRNFGLIREIDSLDWRFAPLFDTGNSLWYDKDEGQVAREDYSFISRPFDHRPARQLMYVEDLSWLDLPKLAGFADEACEILAESDLARWRLDYLREGINERISQVKSLL